MSKIEQCDGFTVEYIGKEKEPLVVIEDFYKNPEHLVADATRRPFKTPPPGYPGIRAQAPSQYLLERGKVLAEILGKVFGYTREAKLIECSYSLVTTPAEKLYPAQRIPHHHSNDPNLIALLHYLCGPEKGGTSHYRHVATGFETVRAARANTYLKTLETEEERDGPPPQTYFKGSGLRGSLKPTRSLIVS